MPGKKYAPTDIKILANVAKDAATGCWNWMRAKDRDGYGSTCVNGKRVSSHRAAYEVFVGPIPQGLFLDHLCRNPSCCNPAHLEPVTNRENLMRGVRKTLQTHCKNGHPLDGGNLKPTKRGNRQCRVCQSAAALRWFHDNKPAPNPRQPKTHCINGHELSGDNLVETVVTQGGKRLHKRFCRTCKRAVAREYAAKQRAMDAH